jgi:hypothetical protein
VASWSATCRSRLGIVMVAAVLGLAATPAVSGGAALTLVAANHSSTLELSLEELAALPQTTFSTETEFTDGMTEFTGPLVRDVLALHGLARIENVRFIAANDYFVDIPTNDFDNYDAILAMTADGKALSRRDRGPLWLMYPISDHSALADPLYLRRLIWQVVRIEAL